MRKLVFSLFAALTFGSVCAQCPTIVNCLSGSPTVCDFSENDSLLWNEHLITWSTTLGTEDLYEGAADFSLKILPCASGTLKITYVLLLDLDNDDLLETAVPSVNLPPAGFVYFNNAFNSGYLGGDPVEFDKRLLPDSLTYQFALEINNSWDTVVASLRWKSGSNYVLPRLPEGKHRLMWWVEQAGVTEYCEYGFRIKDCLPPTLECVPNWSVSLDTATGSATLFLDEILPDAEDNTTPFHQLRISMRKAGEGTGFPLDSANNAVTELQYDCAAFENQIVEVEVWAKDRLSNSQACLTTLALNDANGFCNIFPTLCARPFWDTTNMMKSANFKMTWVDTAQKIHFYFLQKLPEGCAEMKLLPPANAFSLTAEYDTLPLDGVSTYDLLLISRHILNIQPFDAPWKWIAADANQNGAVTTFDMVELRKLILGIYQKLPANTSWRFFNADCVFPPNPFTGGYCPPEYSFLTAPLDQYPLELPFNAVKVGDVNGTASPNFQTSAGESRGEPVRFHLPDLDLEAGKTYEIPLQMAEAGALLGFQFGLNFNSEVIEIEKVSLGSLPNFDENSFAQPEPGTLNVSWFSPAPQVILPDENWLTLRLKALQSARLSEVVFLKNEKLAAEAYAADASIHPLQIHFSKNETSTAQTAIFPPQPNPTSAGASIPVRLAEVEKISLEVADFSGKIIFQQEIPLESGGQMLEIPASAFPAAGVFYWQIKTRQNYRAGKLVRL